MIKKINRKKLHNILHKRVRRKVRGTADRPRLCVFRSTKHIYAQLVDDDSGKILAVASTLTKEIREQLSSTGNIEAAKKVGEKIAEHAGKLNVSTVVFDRGGFKFHGRVKSLADAARAKGLQF
jgi:large subunit ribosomal protein L18